MEKLDNMQEHTGNVSREINTLRMKQKEMLRMKNTITEMKNTLMNSSLEWTQLKKVVYLKIC